VAGKVKVSVALTTYRHAGFIADAIEGVLHQRPRFAYELIIGDDDSDDGTRDIVRDFARGYPDIITTILPDRNLGGEGKRLFARVLDACAGEYIAMLDGDDYWTAPDKLQRQVDFLDAHPECSMCFHNVRCVHEDGSRPATDVNTPDQKPFTGIDEALRNVFIASCSPMFRRDVLHPLPSWYFDVPWGDWPLYVLAAEQGRIGYIDDVMGVYRVHAGGMWSGLDEAQQLEGVIRCYHAMNVGLEFRYGGAIRRRLAKVSLDLAAVYARAGDTSRARKAALASLRYAPFQRRSRALFGMLLPSALKRWRRLLRP